jgi:hypothetical protein
MQLYYWRHSSHAASTNGLRSNSAFEVFVDDFNAIESTGEQVYTNRFHTRQ